MAGLETSDPRVGQTLRVDGAEWQVTDHSSYWSAEGYRVVEWECEGEDAQAYLLKEIQEGVPIRWFFTRRIDEDAVAVAGAGPLARWLEREGSATPPPAVTYQGQTYQYAESTDGTYEDEPGKRVRKTTWEYWDAGRAHNLAVEIWPRGDLDCYHGTYIEPARATLAGDPAEDEGEDDERPARGAAGLDLAAGLARKAGAAGGVAGALAANPFVAAAVFVPVAYVVPFFLGWPFDRAIGVALCLATLGGWVFALFRAPLAAAVSALATPAVLVAFWRYPPLTTAVGVAAVVGAPAVVAWLGGGRGAPSRLPVVYAAAFPVALAALVLGIYHYFRTAPGPHTLAQLVLALGPAALGGLGAALVAAAVLAARPARPS
jgi:hypothetical protein